MLKILTRIFAVLILGAISIFGLMIAYVLWADGFFTPLEPPVTPFPTYSALPNPNQSEPREGFEIEWIYIPEGEFTMGEAGVNSHSVYLEATGESDDEIAELIERAGSLQEPVTVTWHEATAYTEWLSTQLDVEVSLPSEAEWEKAARGHTDTRIYPWGNELDSQKANICDRRCSPLGTDPPNNAIVDGFAWLAPVGSFPEGASPYGVLDMTGNVQEWTRNLYHVYPYNSSTESLQYQQFANEERVVRGGHFFFREAVSVYERRIQSIEDPFGTGFRVVVQIK